jgi:hypothetical protein
MDENGQQCVNNPALSEIVDVLMAMDGKERDSLFVAIRSGRAITVGGGTNDQFKCHVWSPPRAGNEEYDLINPTVEKDMNDTVHIQMEREIATFPKCMMVRRDDVRQALESFCVDGILCDELVWNNTLQYDAYS